MMKESRGTVLIAFAEALSAAEAVFSLQGAGFVVEALSADPRRSVLRHIRGVRLLAVPDPRKSPRSAAAEIERLASTGGYRAILPLEDIAVYLLRTGTLSGSCRIAGPIGDAASFSLDKRLQIEAAARAGLRVPRTIVLESARDRHEPDRFPLILKPAQAIIPGHSGPIKGRSWTVRDPREYARAMDEWRGEFPLLVQQVVRGQGRGVFGLGRAGEVLAMSGHRRIRMMNPSGSGSSCCESVHPAPATASAVARLIRDRGWSGPFMVEILRDTDGIDWFIEVNGRCWGSMALARTQGLEYPAWAVELALDPGFTPPRLDLREGVRCRHLGRDLMHLMFVLRGPRGASPNPWPSRGRALWEVLLRDLAVRPYNLRPGELRLLWADTSRTVVGSLRRSSTP